MAASSHGKVLTPGATLYFLNLLRMFGKRGGGQAPQLFSAASQFQATADTIRPDICVKSISTLFGAHWEAYLKNGEKSLDFFFRTRHTVKVVVYYQKLERAGQPSCRAGIRIHND